MRIKKPTLTRERENAILDAAQRRFAVYGPAKVTMDEIASDVGLGKATLYYYFPAKEVMFQRVIEREQKEFLERIEAIVQSKGSATEKLMTYNHERLRLFAVLLNLNIMNTQSWLDCHPVLNGLLKAFAAEDLKLLTRILREGTRHGEFDVSSPEKVATTLLHTLHGLRLRSIRMANKPDAPEQSATELEHDIDHLFSLIIDGIRKRTIHRKAINA